MSEPQDGAQGTPAPAAPPQQPPPSPPAAEKPRTMVSDLPDDALKKRLDDARATERKALAEKLGMSLEDAEAAIKERDELKKAQLSAEERQKLELEEARGQALKAKQYRERIEELASVEFDALSDDHKAFVSQLAGDDPDARLRVIAGMKKHGFAKPAPSMSPGANTSTATPPPAAPGPPEGSPEFRFQQWKKLPPLLAASYFETHASEIVKSEGYQKST